MVRPMTVGPYQYLEGELFYSAGRARISQREEQQTHCAPEVLWLVKDGKSLSQVSQEESVRSGSHKSGADLAQTLHEPTEFSPDVAQVFDGTAEFDEASLLQMNMYVLLMLKAR